MRASVLVVVAAAIVVHAAAGCGEERKTCYPGEYLGCTCESGAAGYAACSPGGDFTAATCVCDGTTPGIDAGIPDAASADAEVDGADAGACVSDGGGADGGLKTYAQPCTSNEECETCRCETFAGQRLCTTACMTLDQCPASADACTNRGVCRPPL